MLENAWQALPTSVKPGTQTLHTLADEQEPQFDTPHEAVHAVAPAIVLVDPVGHMEHDVAPGNALYEPAAHGKQEPWAKYEPTPHGVPLGGPVGVPVGIVGVVGGTVGTVGTVGVAVGTVGATVGKHADAPTELVDPVGQLVHDVAPGKANEPVTHAVHDVEPEAP